MTTVRPTTVVLALGACGLPVYDAVPGTTTGEETGGSGSSGESSGAPAEDLPPTCAPGMVRACYGGPPRTVDIGACRQGSETCGDDGEWGECLGEVVPRSEVCGDTEDLACDGPSTCGAHLWSRVFGGSYLFWAYAAAVDSAGNIALAGTLSTSALTIGDDYLDAATDLAPWVAKFGPDGAPQWARLIGDTSGGNGYAFSAPTRDGDVTFDADGNVLVTGLCIGDVDFGSGPIPGEDFDPIVAKFSPTGDRLWGRRFSGAAGEVFSAPHMALATTPTGDIWLAGAVDGQMMLDDIEVVSAGYADVLIVHLDPDGTLLGHARHGDGGQQKATAIAIDAAGEIFVAGYVEGELGLAGLASAGLSDAFLAKFDAAGTLRWARLFGDEYDQSATGVAAIGDRIVISGTFNSSITLGGGEFHAPYGEWDWETQGFLGSFTADGEHLWSRRVVAAETLRASPDRIVVAGWCAADGFIGGGGTFGAIEGGCPIVFTIDGAPLWHRNVDYVPLSGDWPQMVAVARGGEVILAVAQAGTRDLGGGDLSSGEEYGLFLAAYAP